MSIINGRPALGHFHMPPPFKRCEHHEQIGGAVAFVFVIDPRRLPFFHRHRHPRFLDKLLGGFVQADQRMSRIARPCVNGQHILHGGYEGAVRFRRDDPLFLEMGLERVFFKTRQIMLSLARSTMSSSTTLFSSNRKLQRARPFGGSEQANAISLVSFLLTIKNRGYRRLRTLLTAQNRLKALF